MKITGGDWKKQGNKIISDGHGTIAVCPAPNTEGVFEFVNNATAISFIPKMVKTLGEIAEGKGRYNKDPLIHCSNTVDDMKALAANLLKEMEAEQ